MSGPGSHGAWQLALSSTHTELLTIIQEAEGHKRDLLSALEASVRTAEQLQVRTYNNCASDRYTFFGQHIASSNMFRAPHAT